MGTGKLAGESQMARILDLILIVISVGGFVALLGYKLVLMSRYRNDPAKLQALVWTDQVFPKRLQRFIYNEDANRAGKASVPNSHVK